jgi:cell division septum initiation protein DivIVA
MNYKAKDFYTLEISTAMRKGYSTTEVDKILDEVMDDYNEYEMIIAGLRKQIEGLKIKVMQTQTGSKIDSDILIRLSNLEKVVFGNK